MKPLHIAGKLALVVLALAVLANAILFVRERMDTIRRDHELIDVTVVENAPPLVAFTTVALGAFRGLVADVLWLRAVNMQEAGNYFEMVQLASWITKLQPRFTGATAFLAWNMSYNISVTFNSFEDRWRWVQRGIELIRDEALLYNPADPELFKELGWIYQHKLGQEMDDANRYYKLQLALQMTEVAGEFPIDWEGLASAPLTLVKFRESLGAGQEILERILGERDLSFRQLETQFRRNQGTFNERLAEQLAAAGLLADVEIFLRARWLRDRLKLDPRRIADLNAEYGDLDWRLPEAHAIYWASRGLEHADGAVNLACERMIFQALSNAFRGGRLVYLADAATLEITPNTSLVDAVNQQYLMTMEQHPDNTSIRAGYENFLIDAVVTLFMFNEIDKAAEFYRVLRSDFDRGKYRRTLEQFALHELAGDIAAATFNQAHATVQGFLFQMCYTLALGDHDRAEAFERIAATVWRRYMDDIGAGSQQRRGLPPYRQMKRNMYDRCLEQFPEPLANRLRAAALQHQPDLTTAAQSRTGQ